ncbi:MAG: anti-sigma factor antagonist [Klenkia sp.]|nr:anti-sigma factor antagonist [Klenkia sp.]
MIEFQTHTRDDGVGVLAPVGRLTMVAAPQLRGLVSQLVEQGHARIVVDLSGTDFIDSSGLGALIAGLKTTRQAGGDLRLAAVGPQVQAVLELTNLHRVLRPRPDVAGAFDGD